MQKVMDGYFDHIIGVTNYSNNPVLNITFWASRHETLYIRSKPIHSTQEEVGKVEERHLRQQYPKLEDGAFFHIKCKDNYELQREFVSHFDGLVLLEPTELKETIKEKIRKMKDVYNG